MSAQFRILVVEDDPLVMQTLATALETACHAQVWTASDGDQGLVLAGLHKPDLVLMDLDVPGLDGLALCAAIAERSEMIGTKIWIMTGLTVDEETRETLACYADKLIQKPLSVVQLSAEICAEITPQGPPLQWLGD